MQTSQHLSAPPFQTIHDDAGIHTTSVDWWVWDWMAAARIDIQTFMECVDTQQLQQLFPRGIVTFV